MSFYTASFEQSYTATKTVEPTCTAQGYTVETCSVCGATRNTNYVLAKGHSFTTYVRTVDPTCTMDGYQIYSCSRCSKTQQRNYTDALGHDFGPGPILEEKCRRCGESSGIGVIEPTTDIGRPTEPSSPAVDYDTGEAPDETIPPVEEPVPDEEPAPEESNEPVGQSGEKILESETTSSYSYIYANEKLLQEKVTTNGTTETHNFFYDNTGKPYAMQINGTTYYYVTNLQGDVMGLVDTNGNTIATYTYDPYGKVLTATGTLAEKNPLRYRGYYYDSESGLYYLQSRYYDPAVRRFVNADSYASTGQGIVGYNMFSYCSNSPIIRSDPDGNFGILGIIAVGAVVGGLLGAFSAATTGGDILESAIEGCLTGALGAACAFLPVAPIWTITISMVGGALVDLGVQVSSQYIEKGKVEEIDAGRAVKTGIQTGLGTAIPQYGNVGASSVDAFGTAIMWSEASTLIACADVAASNMIATYRPTFEWKYRFNDIYYQEICFGE